MLHQRLLFLFLLTAHVSADAEPARVDYTRNDSPKWMPFYCDTEYDCPLLKRRQRKSHSEICIFSSPNWYKFTWESAASKFDRSKAIDIAVNVAKIFQHEKFLKMLYEANKDNLDDKKNENPKNWIKCENRI